MTTRSVIRKRKCDKRDVSTAPSWRILKEGGWTHLAEAEDHLVELERLYTNKNPDERFVLQETDDRKLVVRCSKCGVFMLTEFSKMIGLSKSDKFEVKRVSLVKPLTSLLLPTLTSVE